MSEKKDVSVKSDDEGFIVISIAGKEFKSVLPVLRINYKYKAKDITDMIFAEV